MRPCSLGLRFDMSSNQYVSTAYLKLFLRSATSLSGLSSVVLLESTGLTELELERAKFVEWPRVQVMLANLDVAGVPPGWAALLGRQLNAASHGPLGFAALSAPNLSEALAILNNYYRTRLTTTHIEIKLVDNRIFLTLRDLTGDSKYGIWMIEMLLGSIQSIVETIVSGSVVKKIAIQFSHRQTRYVKELNYAFGTDCYFGKEYNALVIPEVWMKIRSPLYDESSYNRNKIKCQEIMDSVYHLKKDSVGRVRNRIMQHFERTHIDENFISPPPNLEYLANQQNISVRTLIRRLKANNTCYKKMLEDARREKAVELLKKTHLTITDIGEKLGYGESANFSRAFKKWYGMSPVTWRRYEE